MSTWNWRVIVPVGAIALALLAVLWFDLTTGGEATPKPLVGAIGTPVRGTFIPPVPTATAPPEATARPQVTTTVPAGAPGTPEQRDATRRSDVLVLVQALNATKAGDGSFPSTNGNVQTLCTYKELDAGCKLEDALGGKIPTDPFGANAGYWYSSDGNTAAVYASLEVAISAEQRCQTDDPELAKHPNVVCARIS